MRWTKLTKNYAIIHTNTQQVYLLFLKLNMPDTTIKIITLNCRGLATREKRADMFAKLKEEKNDILLLQDIHWDNELLLRVKEEWGYKMICSTYTTQARGTAILFNNSFEFVIGETKRDPGGNFTLAEINLSNNISIVLGSIYGPNQDNPTFYTNLDSILSQFENPNIILGGDWNSTRVFAQDNKNYINHNNPRTNKAITDLCQTYNLVDSWRVNNPQKLQYTWIQGISNKQARLDYFLITEELLSITTNNHIGPKYRSDHAPVNITINLSKHTRGPGIWKLNNSLLMDEDFIKLIKKEIIEFKLIYTATPYNQDYIRPLSHGFELMIDISLFWETLLTTLRGVIITYSGKKRKESNREKKRLSQQITALDTKINTGNGTRADYTRLVELNSALINLRKTELDGAFIRSRADWLDHGEKPSKYFLNLENKNRVNKNINEIKKEDDTIIRDQDMILKELKNFYETLYEEKETQNINDYNPDIMPSKISDDERNALEEPITKIELDNALSKMKNNKSPGLDGYSPEFFKRFWPQLGDLFLESINSNFKKGSLSQSQKEGIITCLPKSGKERDRLKNWRPISLLNSTYKLISLCITNRLRPLLHNIISTEQKGFIEGRSIADCTRLMCAIIYECEKQLRDGLILLVDFEKAFDSLSWKYIHEILPKFNLGPNFIKWISMFQNDSQSRVILNGHLSTPFKLKRGCRQGDPISPYIFILCSEMLALAFKNEPNFEGIKVLHKDHRLSQYADDTSIFMKASSANLNMSLKILNWFYSKSGLKINVSKTKVIRIGQIRETDRRFGRENNLDWVNTFTALGIEYDVLNMEYITQNNIKGKIDSMRNAVRAWGCRNITPIGRVAVLKSLVLSRITHILLSLPSPSKDTIKTIEDICYQFIWKNNRHEVSKKTITKEIKDGGLKMLNIQEFDRSLKLTWMRKILNQTPEWAEFTKYYRIDYLLVTDTNYHAHIKKTITNPFWKDVSVAYWDWFSKLKTFCPAPVDSQLIWGNPNLNLPINNNLLRQKIIYIRDLYNNEGIPLTQIELELKTGIKMFFTHYQAIRRSIPQEWNQYMLNFRQDYNLSKPINIEWLTKDKKGGTSLRKIWQLSANETPPISQQRWSEELNIAEEINWPFSYMLPFKCRLNARIKYFQYQINHRSLITNKKLFQFELIDHEECDKCNEVETIQHLLVECDTLTNLWDNVHRWLRERVI